MTHVPYVIEGSDNKEKVYDLYSRMLRDRIIFIGQEFNDALANSVVAQLLFLEADDPEKDITVYINSPGGIVSSALSIYDTMNYVACDISTVCFGAAASAGAFILAAGAKGKRFALPNSRIMLHQLSTGIQGTMQDIEVEMVETRAVNDILFEELSKMTGNTKKKLRIEMDRNKHMSASEAKKFGVIDEVMTNRNG